MKKHLTGWINVTKLMNAGKSRHSAFNKSERSGDVYANVNLWYSDVPNEHGQHLSISLQSSKEAYKSKSEPDEVFIGNAKIMEPKRVEPKADDFGWDGDGIPVGRKSGDGKTGDGKTESGDDLPF